MHNWELQHSHIFCQLNELRGAPIFVTHVRGPPIYLTQIRWLLLKFSLKNPISIVPWK